MSCGTESAYAEERRIQLPGEDKLRPVNFTRILQDTELLTGTPTVTVSPTGPTIGTPTINTATYVNDSGTTVGIGKAVLFRVSNVTAGVEYKFSVTCPTTNSDTAELYCIITGV